LWRRAVERDLTP
jgi:hypothetical protein